MKFEIRKTKGGYYWRMVARNGEILSHSETFERKRDIRDTIKLIKDEAADAPIRDVR